MLDEELKKLIEKKIQLIKVFIDQPSVENAKRAAHSLENDKLHTCGVSDEWDGPCCECVWEPVCQWREHYRQITDEMISAMVLDAIKRLAVYEAKHG